MYFEDKVQHATQKTIEYTPALLLWHNTSEPTRGQGGSVKEQRGDSSAIPAVRHPAPWAGSCFLGKAGFAAA